MSGGVPLSGVATHRGRSGEATGLDPQAQTISHLLIGHANECDMDGHGRVLLPQSLREFANLDRHAKMIGLVRKFELWEEQRWAERRDEYLGQIGELRSEPAGPLRDLVL